MNYGILGAGKFGTALANLMANNGVVYLYTRRKEVCETINKNRIHNDVTVHQNVIATNSIEEVCNSCEVIFPVIPSVDFREIIKTASPFLMPNHILIHGVKGVNIVPNLNLKSNTVLYNRESIRTMSEIILEETNVLLVGCLSGPNLVAEMNQNMPTATVIASRFNKVIEAGKIALKSKNFLVYGSHDHIGIELAGVLKNVIAIAAGILYGKQFGENAKGFLMTRGLSEMIIIGKALNANPRAFMGLAGIGDLIATCSSQSSRNFTIGKLLAQNKSINEIKNIMNEVAEGVFTVKVAKGICNYYRIDSPIVSAIYSILYNNKGELGKGETNIDKVIENLMKTEIDLDANFWEVL